MSRLYLNEEFSRHWQDRDPFQELAELDGKVFRELAGRKTFQFEFNGRSYFAKLHFGIGWGEVFKNLLQMRLPVISARNEWAAIQRLQKLGIDTMTAVAYGEKGWSPAARRSFIVTEDLIDTVSLEDVCLDWGKRPPNLKFKRLLIERLANISRTLHGNGICHRDYYLCHFLMHKNPGESGADMKLSLIDLHRALIQRNLGKRWIVKDLAGLYYSAMHIGLTRNDLFRFIRRYDQNELRTALQTNQPFWNAVTNRAMAMYRKLGRAR